MTSIVGIYCTDGAVIATDSAATAGVKGFHTVSQQSRKIYKHNESAIIGAGTGAVGLGQRFWGIVNNKWKPADGKKLNYREKSSMAVAKELSSAALTDFSQTIVIHLGPNTSRKVEAAFGALVAYPSKEGHALCEFEVETLQPELKSGDDLWYCSLGSAITITDTFLSFIRSVFWQNGPPNLREGTFAAIWTLQHAIDVNTGMVGGPPQVATLSKNKNGHYRAQILEKEDMEQHQLYIDEAKKYIGQIPSMLFKSKSELNLPKPPANQ